MTVFHIERSGISCKILVTVQEQNRWYNNHKLNMKELKVWHISQFFYTVALKLSLNAIFYNTLRLRERSRSLFYFIWMRQYKLIMKRVWRRQMSWKLNASVNLSYESIYNKKTLEMDNKRCYFRLQKHRIYFLKLRDCVENSWHQKELNHALRV